MSEPFIIEKSRKTPYICFDQNIGKLEIMGYSLPADSQEFYQPLMDQIENYLKDPLDVTELFFHIEYFNTSSSKIILQLLQKFEIIIGMGKEVSAVWYVDEDDNDMYDAGKTYQASVRIPVTLSSFPSE